MSLNRRIFKDAIAVTTIGAVAQAVGFFVPVLVAQRFGANYITDAYYLAFSVPSLITGIIIGGAIKIVFVPVLVEERVKNPDSVQEIVGVMMLLLLLLSCLGVLIVGILAILDVLKLGKNLQTAVLTQQLIIEMLPLIPLTLLISLFNAIYNSYQRFALAEAAQAVQFVLVIAFLLLFAQRWGIHSLVAGQVLGHTAALLIVVGIVKRQLGVSLRPRWKMPEGFKRMLKLSVLPFAAYLLIQFNPFTARLISAYLSEGSVSVLSYAQRLASVPSLLIGSSFATVLVSHWSLLSAEEDRDALRESLNRTVSVLILVLFPVAAGLVLVREPLVSLVLRRGAFDARSALITADVFAILAIQIVPIYLHSVIVRVLLAEKAMKTLFWLSAMSTALHLALMASFAWVGLGVWGIALAMLLSSTLVALTTAVIVHKRYVALSVVPLVKGMLRVIVAVAAIIVVVMWLQSLISAVLALSELVVIMVCGLAGSVLYFSVLRMLGHPDLVPLWGLIVSQINLLRAAYSTPRRTQ